MPSPETYQIHRSGEFTAYLKGKTHCGNVPEVNTFKYEATICVTNKGLDRRGFVIDNLDIGKLFSGITETALSCEKLAAWAANQLLSLLGPRSKHCMFIRVLIWGTPHAHIEYEWRKE